MNRFLEKMHLYMAYIAGAILVFVTLSVTFDVVMRYIFNRPTQWVVDVSEYALVFILFLTVGWTLAKQGHVEISLLINILPKKAQQSLSVISSAIGFFVCALLFYESIKLILQLYVSKELFFKALVIPKWTVFTVVPVGFLSLMIQFLIKMLLTIGNYFSE